MGLLVFFVIAGYVTISNAVSCYNCTESNLYLDSETGSFNSTPCMTPGSSNDLVFRENECPGTCVTILSFSIFSPSSSFIFRSCVEDDASIASQCNECTSPSNCRLCCDSDRCNGAPMADIIQDNRIAQTCYNCRHSEIPGAGSFNPGCGLDFDPEGMEGADVSYSFCEGLCYSAVTFIDGVEDVMRGCSRDGSRPRCDYANNPYREDKSVDLGDFAYDMKCCLGSLCNGAQSVGATASIVLTMLSYYIVFLALVT